MEINKIIYILCAFAYVHASTVEIQVLYETTLRQ